MLAINITIILVFLILLVLLLLARSSSELLEEDLPKDLKEQDEIDLEEATKLLLRKLSRHAYIEDNKVKLRVLRKK